MGRGYDTSTGDTRHCQFSLCLSSLTTAGGRSVMFLISLNLFLFQSIRNGANCSFLWKWRPSATITQLSHIPAMQPSEFISDQEWGGDTKRNESFSTVPPCVCTRSAVSVPGDPRPPAAIYLKSAINYEPDRVRKGKKKKTFFFKSVSNDKRQSCGIKKNQLGVKKKKNESLHESKINLADTTETQKYSFGVKDVNQSVLILLWSDEGVK